jgi:tRNA(Arg) A34 adenosine deaminase TadA
MQFTDNVRRAAYNAALTEAARGSRQGHGGPFGAAVINAEGNIIAVGHNTVLKDCDPTRHAEMNAISAAGRALGSAHLKDCILVASSEPCPMCLAASYWARVKEVWYVLPAATAAEFGFDDVLFYQEMALPPEQRSLRVFQPEDALVEPATEVFRRWKEANGKIY